MQHSLDLVDRSPQLVKGKTPVCMYVEGGELAGCRIVMIG